MEIIIDPVAGLVIGERVVNPYRGLGLGTNNLASHTAIDYGVVHSAPPDNTPTEQTNGVL